MGSNRDCRDDHQDSLVEGLDDALVFIKALGALRIAEHVLCGSGIGIVVSCAMSGVWWPMVAYIMLGAIIARTVDIGKTALKIAIETEEERNEERENYRRLSEQLCLREFRKGQEDGRS
jgi:hypothetical protein